MQGDSNTRRPGQRVVVAGGTGYIGGGVLEALRAHGHWVRALCRDPGRLDVAADDIFVGEATRPETLRGLCDGIDTVFSSIGVRSLQRRPSIWEVDYQANLNLLRAAQRAGVRHFVFVSVANAAEMARWSPIAEARGRVARAVQDSGLEFNVFAPTGFYNDMLSILRAAQRGTVWLLGDGSGRSNPLSALDFGAEVARVIAQPGARNQLRQVGGCEVLTHRQVAEMAFAATGGAPHIRHLPAALLAALAVPARLYSENARALLKFFEYVARAREITGEPLGQRRLADLFARVAAGESLRAAERAIGPEVVAAPLRRGAQR
jgi:uncharacterized protein YbjT (DUF2867 family)